MPSSPATAVAQPPVLTRNQRTAAVDDAFKVLTADPYGHEKHPLLGRAVEDLASGQCGTLRAVVITEVPTHSGRHAKVRLAYIAPPGGGLEWTTSPANIREAAQ